MINLFCLIALYITSLGLITLYITSVVVCLLAHKKVGYDQDGRKLKIFSTMVLFIPLVNIFLVISLLLMEIRDGGYKIKSLNIEKNRLINNKYDLERKLEKLRTENIIKSISVGDTFRIPDNEGWVEACRGKLCKIKSITSTHVHHTVEGTEENYKTPIELMEHMIFINKKGVMPFKFIK